MRAMRPAALLITLLLVALGCDRAEEPRSRTVHEAREIPVASAPSPPRTAPPRAVVPPASAHPTAPPSARPTESVRPAACVVETPAEPPPEAKPAARCPPDPLKKPPHLPRARVVFTEAAGEPAVDVERAVGPEVRSRGLMYRTHLPEDEGMLFSWETAEPRSFWMRNTCIPLDMLFIDADGVIAGILEEVPTLNEESRRNPCPVPHVLEVNAGYCRRHGIRAGQRIRIEDITP